MIRRAIIIACGTLMIAGAAVAVEPDEILDDPALEARARAISKNLRCLVCQNQSIDDSNAGWCVFHLQGRYRPCSRPFPLPVLVGPC